MKYIDPKLFSQFTRNELSKSKMEEIEEDLRSSKTANAVFHALIEDYHNTPNAEELIGEDEERYDLWGEREKKFDEVCKNIGGSGSIVVNQLNYTNMNDVNFTKKEMAKVTERYKAIVADHDDSVSLKENLINAYMKAHSKTRNEAEVVVDKLMDGCNTLTRKYNEALKNDFNVETEIDSICEGKSVEERYSFLINALAMVETLNLDSFSALTDINSAVKNAIEDYNSKNQTPTEEDCKKMKELLAEALANNTILVSSLEKAFAIFRTANEGETSVVYFTSQQYDDARLKAEMALAAWLVYEAGGISSVQRGASPEIIGVSAATAVEEAKIMRDLASESKIDVAIRCLKILGGVALTCVLGYYGILTVAYLTSIVTYGLLSLLGTSLLAGVVTMALVFSLIWGMAPALLQTGIFIVEKADRIFDYVVEKLRESIFPKIKEISNNFVEWLKEKFNQQRGQTDVEVEPVVTPA